MPPPSSTPREPVLSEELQQLEDAAHVRQFRAGEQIFSSGDPGDGFYVVKSGQVQISAVVGNDQTRVLATIGPGDFFGEMALLDDAPRSATARAESDTKALFLSREELLGLLEEQPRLALNLVREFSKRMRALNRKYLDEIVQAERLAAIGRFAATIVHDFKNPLAVIGLAAEVACHDGTTPPMRQKVQSRIIQQVDHMTSMLQELIEFTSPSLPRPTLLPMSFASFMIPLAASIRQEIAERHIMLDVPMPPPDVTLRIEPRRLTRLFYNLVNNAADEMPEGGRITLRFRVGQGELGVDLTDTGKGIDPKMSEQLFQPFATHGKAHGTGLGLSICKKIAEDHGGRIWAHSESGSGATFSLALPLMP